MLISLVLRADISDVAGADDVNQQQQKQCHQVEPVALNHLHGVVTENLWHGASLLGHARYRNYSVTSLPLGF